MKKVYDGLVLIMVALVTTAVGDVVVFADSIGIAQTFGEVGEKISVDTVGVYNIPVKTDDAVNVGDVLYWDNTNKYLTVTADSNTKAGVSWSAKTGSVIGSVDIKIG